MASEGRKFVRTVKCGNDLVNLPQVGVTNKMKILKEWIERASVVEVTL